MKLSGTSDLSHSTIYEAHIPSINIVQGKFSWDITIGLHKVIYNSDIYKVQATHNPWHPTS